MMEIAALNKGNNLRETHMRIKLADIKIVAEYCAPRTMHKYLDYLADFETPDITIKKLTEEDYSCFVNKNFLSFQRDIGNEGIAVTIIDLESIIIYKKIVESLLDYNVILVHGAAISVDNKCYVFIAPSGIGKTTHILNWINMVPNTIVVNGDKPLVNVDKKLVYGSPWCGKEGMNKNVAIPLAGIISLKRGESNSIRRIDYRTIFPELLQQCYIPQDGKEAIKAYRHIGSLASIPCYQLYCNMDKESALVAYEGLLRHGKRDSFI